MEDDIGRAVRILNELLEADPEAISKIVGYRVDANEKLAAHPTAQCGGYGTVHTTIGALGIINGFFGVRDNGQGYIAAEVGAGGRVERFIRLA